MSPDDVELIARLCTRAGMIMEDASAIALGVHAEDHITWAQKLAYLEGAVIDMQMLIGAASSLFRIAQGPSQSE